MPPLLPHRAHPQRRLQHPWLLLLWLLLLGLGTSHSEAANTPCSGRKGGVDHCQQGQFVCRDGSISASKKICHAPAGPAPQRLTPTAPRVPGTANGDCSCRAGLVCTGPRGGRYCLSDSGRKSYVRP